MKRVHRNFLIVLLVIFFIVLIFISPYNIFQRINAKRIILNDNILSGEFNKNNVIAVEYKGDNTFFVNTDKKQFVVIRENTSFMNYKWKIFEYKENLPK